MIRPAIAAELEEQIVSGRLEPGAKLPSERQLSDHYGVSRPIVRESLRALVERHLVDVQPGRGAFVRHASATDVSDRMATLFRRRQTTPRDLSEARMMLECTAAALAAERAIPADLAAIAETLDRFDRAAGIIEQARYDLAFHLAVARAAANPVIETMFGAISGLAVELMLRSLADPDVAGAAVPHHRTIHQAIAARDPAAARAAMAAHLEVAAQFYGPDYDQNLETVARRELQRLLDPTATLDDLLAATGVVRREP